MLEKVRAARAFSISLVARLYQLCRWMLALIKRIERESL